MKNVSLVAALFLSATVWADEDTLLRRVHTLLREVPLIDGHNDLAWQYRKRVRNRIEKIDLSRNTKDLKPTLHTDLPRMRAGGVGAQFWSVYVPVAYKGSEAVQAVVEQIDVVHRFVNRYPDTLELALTAADIERIHRSGKIASLIGMEGGHSIGNSMGALRMLYRLGARSMTITHSKNVDWADSATDDPEHNGLSPFGEEFVREMNRLGMLVDLSHVSPDTMHDALDVTAAPVLFTHSSARSVTGHARNVPDDVLKRLPERGSVIMVTFVPTFVSEKAREDYAAVSAEKERLEKLHPGDPGKREELLEQWREQHPKPQATLAQVADHIEYVIKLIGVDHVGIGGDFDGIETVVEGLEDVSCYPRLLVELLRRGLSDKDIKKIAGLNVLRAMKEVERTARHLRDKQPPAAAVFKGDNS